MIIDYFRNDPITDKEAVQQHYETFCEGWAMPGLATRGEMENYLFRNRLTDVRYANNTDKVLRSSRRMYRLARAYLPFDRFLNLLKVSSDENITGDLASVSQYYFFKDNIGTHGLLYARKPPNA